jgi:hypothetical protein
MARTNRYESFEELKARAEHSYQRAEEVIEQWQDFVDQKAREVRTPRVVSGDGHRGQSAC